MKKFVKKADLILLIAILALSLLGFVVLRKNASSNSMVAISVSGKNVGSYPLNKNASFRVYSDGSVEKTDELSKALSSDFQPVSKSEDGRNAEAGMNAEAGRGYNDILIQDGYVRVLEANCPNHDCMNFGKISKEGQVILCLPHKLAVTIVNGEAQSDAISY